MNRIKEFTANNPLAALASAGVVGFVLGGTISHIYTKKKYLEDDWVYEAVGQIEEDIDLNQLTLFDQDDSTINFVSDDVVEEIREIVVNPKNNPADIVVEEVEEIEEQMETPTPNVVSIFHSKDGSGWDWDKETAKRSSKEVYQIHKDEFFAEESGYDQTTLTYYAGDDILVDEQEVPIYNHKAIVGNPKFGHGSGDQNVAYVRNDKVKGEYEIIRDEGLYQIEVLGHQLESDFELQDRKRESVHKFRDE